MKKFESIYEDNLELFIHENLTNRPEILFREIEELAVKMKVPILSPATGEVLKYIIEKEKPSKILELGTGIGYSILWMLSSQVSITIESWERNPVCIATAENYIKKYISTHQNIIIKNLHILDECRKTDSFKDFDLIFIDCDKICYPELIETLPFKMKKDSIILIDNVLWHGRLLSEVHNKPSDKAIQKFWEIVIHNHKNRTLFPVGDGLLLIKI
jgi:caffeoyl-CoA O-methyltransferase